MQIKTRLLAWASANCPIMISHCVTFNGFINIRCSYRIFSRLPRILSRTTAYVDPEHCPRDRDHRRSRRNQMHRCKKHIFSRSSEVFFLFVFRFSGIEYSVVTKFLKWKHRSETNFMKSLSLRRCLFCRTRSNFVLFSLKWHL